MTYASGGLISATDYNTLAFNGTNIGNHWGTGTGSAGLGQSTSAIATVATGNTVTATQWTGLIQTINSCLGHEGQTAITPSSVATGNVVTYYASIATGSALAYTNRGTTGLPLVAGTAGTSFRTAPWGSTGNQSVTFLQSVTFSSGNAARYFFNAGGKISLTFARSGGSATTRNTGWTNLLAAFGTINIGYKNTTKVGGSGSPATLLNSNNGGYWAGTDSLVVHFRQYDSVYNYNLNYGQVEYYWSGTASNGGYPVLNIKTSLFDVDSGGTDYVDGTTSVSLVVNSPATTYLSNTWGTPTVGGIGNESGYY